MNDWKPIETAPKDGTDILLEVIGWAGSKYIATVFWDESTWVDNGKGFGLAGSPGDWWMPLPEAPNE